MKDLSRKLKEDAASDLGRMMESIKQAAELAAKNNAVTPAELLKICAPGRNDTLKSQLVGKMATHRAHQVLARLKEEDAA